MSVVALVGPTASGKSETALAIARRDPKNTVLLSCDSLLVYSDLVIGTAKPSEQELKEIPHFGINLVSAGETFTAGDYVRYAAPKIIEWVAQKKKVLIVGGTGFYLKALLLGVWDAPPTQPELRTELDKISSEELYARLEKADPEHAAKIKANDRYRVIRSLEIIEVTGKKVSEINHVEAQKKPLPFEVPVLGVRRAPMDLERRIRARTNEMFEAGLVEEARALLKKYPDRPKSLQCVGYKEVLDFFDEKLNLQECRERIVISTRQLAKKQRTFFKSMPFKIDWYQLPTQQEELSKRIVETLDE